MEKTFSSVLCYWWVSFVVYLFVFNKTLPVHTPFPILVPILAPNAPSEAGRATAAVEGSGKDLPPCRNQSTWKCQATKAAPCQLQQEPWAAQLHNRAKVKQVRVVCCVSWWLLLDDGGILLNSESLKLEGIWRENKTLTLLQVKKKEEKGDLGEQYLKQTAWNTGY